MTEPSFTRGEYVLEYLEEVDIYALPDREETMPATAKLAMTEADDDRVTYQLIRMQYDLAGRWVRGELSDNLFIRDYDLVSDAMKLHKRNTKMV